MPNQSLSATVTRLDAVNTMLSGIGSAPINSLDTPGVDGSQALAILDETNRAVQARGWHFNWQKGVKLLPDAFPPNYIKVAENTLDVRTVGKDAALNVVVVDGHLFNVGDNTYSFTAPVECDVLILLRFEHLSAVVQHYITVRAARIFQARTIGSADLHGLTAADEQQAYLALVRAETNRAKPNSYRDNSSARARLRRGGTRRWA